MEYDNVIHESKGFCCQHIPEQPCGPCKAACSFPKGNWLKRGCRHRIHLLHHIFLPYYIFFQTSTPGHIPFPGRSCCTFCIQLRRVNEIRGCGSKHSKADSFIEKIKPLAQATLTDFVLEGIGPSLPCGAKRLQESCSGLWH